MGTWKEDKHHLLIEGPDIFDFQVNLDYLQRDSNECMYVVENEMITRVIEINHIRTLVRIKAVDNNDLAVEFLANTRPELVEDREEVVRYIKEWFDLDKDLRPFYEIGCRDPLLEQSIEKCDGLRIIGLPDLFEALCWGILGQQINLTFAYTLKRQFVEQFGEFIQHKGQTYWIFPSFEKISALTVEDLADIKMTKRKSEYIIDVAKLMKSGDLTKEKLLHMADFKQAEQELIRIRGIGPWTANYVLMRCLRYPAAFPIDDVGLINAIKHVKGMDRKPTKKEIRNLALKWSGWESYATFYLWRMLY
ncbi:DNA-3-methyladenine glycosylase family protein [Gracilibacillus alcaliphilus]|uniref:DNA-3-methyladenine glycosylase family protein n=1 Tax=Gracilibacillus alcaliphilus TaxID=1401441 RepID=UPI00195B6D9C|nr:DNA-3-methyladenine glycosylase [Gracilibacillus alcaliphilus]MBM7675330.1 DNA-3-methyladenine glycosylase II [Gracilibacillus alcaliphilus]